MPIVKIAVIKITPSGNSIYAKNDLNMRRHHDNGGDGSFHEDGLGILCTLGGSAQNDLIPKVLRR